MPLAMSLTFAMIAIWWVVMSLPLLRRYQQKFMLIIRLTSFKLAGAFMEHIEKSAKE